MERKYTKENEYQDLKLGSEEKNKNIENFQDIQVKDSVHKLASIWCFWYASRKIKDHSIPYADRLKKFAEFSSIEDFFKYYVYLKSASEIDRNTDISLFKLGYQPLWESCPNSGCLFVRYKKHDNQLELNVQWEKLLFSLIGEQFDEPAILGATLSIRSRETIIEIWFEYNKNEKIKTILGHKLTELLDLDKSLTVFFKDNSISIEDQSTLKNAETYNFGKRKNTYY